MEKKHNLLPQHDHHVWISNSPMTTQKHIEQLTSCYDQHADTFATTRERFRPEIDFCMQALPPHTSKTPYTVVDL